MHQPTSACRLCGNTELVEVLDLGWQAVNDVFPRARTQHVTAAPLKLVKCNGDETVCGLLQLAHTHKNDESSGRTDSPLSVASGWPSTRHDSQLRKRLERVMPECAV